MLKILNHIMILLFIMLTTGCSSYHVKVIDQHGQPVPDVIFVTGISSLSFPVPFAQVNPTVEFYKTDSDGRFRNGDSRLVIRYIEANGYEFSHEKGFGSSSPPYHSGGKNSYNKPYTIIAWKRQEPELLKGTEHDRGLQVIPDNQYYKIDIMRDQFRYLKKKTGKSLESIDAELLVQYKEYKEVILNRHSKEMHPWELSLVIPNGGLIVTNDIFRNVAPKDGYQKKWTVRSSDLPRIDSSVTKKFYMKSKSGQVYGQFTIKFRPYLRNLAFTSYWLNTNGNRNLTRPKKYVYCISHHHRNCSIDNYHP